MQLRYISVPSLIAEAGGDPWAVNESLQAGSPFQISQLAKAFHAAGRCTSEADNAFGQARNRFDAAWNRHDGDHPINDSAEVQRVTESLGAQSLHVTRIGVDLENIAAALAEAQKAGAGQIAALEAQLQRLDGEIGQAVELEKDPALGAADRDALEHLITACEDDAIGDTRAALGRLQSIRDRYSASLRKSLGDLHAEGYDATILQRVDADSAVPPPGTGAEDVHRWWTSLTPEQRQRFVAEHPDRIGNLNGVPILARNDANKAVMNRDLDRVREIAGRNSVSVDDVLRDPGRYGLSATDITRYHNADETKQGLDHNSDHGHNPVYLFAYEPTAFGGKGRAAICIGNPDTAKNTAVIVPGTSSSVKGGWLREGHNDALNLYGQANAADPNNSTAVIAWMGYDAPNDFKDLQPISTPMLARTGGAALARDVNGLWATHLGGGQHVTVLGHSYGSTTVADAFAMHDMHANDAVLIGCPGTDPGLGADPAADGFGSVRFRAEVPGSDGINARHDHSQYYNLGGEALHSMADVTSGHGDALQADGVTAGHQHQPGLQISIPGLGPVNVGPQTPAFVDPEWERSPGSIADDHYFDAEHHH